MTSAFSSEDSVDKQIDFVPREATEASSLARVYEIERSADWIKDNTFSKVALQFPDEQLKDSVPVQQLLQNVLPPTVTTFILGDTSYGSCCVDEVAADHYGADSIIHFGSACLSPTQRLPVLYCFCPLHVDIKHACQEVQDLVTEKSSRLILIADTMYQHAIDSLGAEVQSIYNEVITSRLQIPLTGKRSSDSLIVQATPDCGSVSTSNQETSSAVTLNHRVGTEKIEDGESNSERSDSSMCSYCKCNRSFSLPKGSNLEDYIVLFLGEEGRMLTNLMMTMNKCPFVTFNPGKGVARRETLNVSKELMKRYYMIERAKDANIVGIVVGTLGVSRAKEMIAHLKKLVKEAGKKSYTFAVGKLNVAKLANFMEVDVFVLVACPQNSLIDSKEFVKPVITPFEMEVACNQARQWTGDYVTDFSLLLPGAAEYIPAVTAECDTTDVSLISNKLRSLGQRSGVEASSVVMLRSDALTVATDGGAAKDAAEYLASRSWKGLESCEGEGTPVAKLKQGRAGIPTQYDDEPMS